MNKPPQAKSGPKKKAPRKLKVFEATLGFYDTVVAAPSQAAALRAWGSHQNLFADGTARVSQDLPAAKAALAQPEVVLRRAIGTKDSFGLNPGTPKIPDLPRGRKIPRSTGASANRKVEARPEPVDRTALDEAEVALAKLEREHRAELDELAARRRALEADQRQAKQRFDQARTHAQRRVDRERKAYAKAGGELKA